MQFQENPQTAMADQLIFVAKFSHGRPKKVAGDPQGKAKTIFIADKRPKSNRNWVNFRPKVAESLATEIAKLECFRWVLDGSKVWGDLSSLE